MIAGKNADTFYMTEQAFAKAFGAADKELVLIDGATHIRTYYDPAFVAQISAKLVGFFADRLR